MPLCGAKTYGMIPGPRSRRRARFFFEDEHEDNNEDDLQRSCHTADGRGVM